MTASSMAHNFGKHPNAKEERKVLEILFAAHGPVISFFKWSDMDHLVFLPSYLFFPNYYYLVSLLFTAPKAAHWEETTGEDKQLFGSAQRNRDRSVQAGCEYYPLVSHLRSTSKQRRLSIWKASHLSTAVQAGESGYFGNDGETSAEHPE